MKVRVNKKAETNASETNKSTNNKRKNSARHKPVSAAAADDSVRVSCDAVGKLVCL